VARLRAHEETEIATELARRTTMRPEGFAVLFPGRISPVALSSLIQAIAGAPYPPSPSQINDLAAQPRPATVAGARMMRAGRFGNGLLIVREEAAVMEPVEASPDALWDNRFRVIGYQNPSAAATIGKLGAEASRFRAVSELPSAVLRTLPAVRFGKSLVAVPHLGYAAGGDDKRITVLFTPPRPVAGPCFVPAA
jgi:tRNA(Ile)-lysidine synthase